jgi:hypothetical protein
VGSFDRDNIYYARFAEGAKAEDVELKHQDIGQFKGTIVGEGTLFDKVAFMTSREKEFGLFFKILAGPLNPMKDNWAGPGGSGPPLGKGNWSAMGHDFNWNTNGITFWKALNPFISKDKSDLVIQSNKKLILNAGFGYQAFKFGLIFGTENVLQNVFHNFRYTGSGRITTKVFGF